MHKKLLKRSIIFLRQNVNVNIFFLLFQFYVIIKVPQYSNDVAIYGTCYENLIFCNYFFIAILRLQFLEAENDS